MAEREITKKYSNGELTVVWKPHLCIHSGNCVRALPKVYNPNEKPWIKAENASTTELKAQIATCPSGALSYVLENKPQEKEEAKKDVLTKIEVRKNGPLLVHGYLEVTHDDTTDRKERTTAFCRCGSSGNKPYCDGTHNKIAFQG
ncbi:MAG: (4Fe-4S)-binding protein [Maribacter sp.]|nr:(4Fe-4S)-binding protein [Maribacter sp.]